MENNSTPALTLHLSEVFTTEDLPYQVLTIELTRTDRVIEPKDLQGLSLPAPLVNGTGVVITGRAPIWLYGFLVHECHPAVWVACYDPRLGAVVVATHSQSLQVGQVLPIGGSSSVRSPKLCPALMVVGPPNSGKSVFSHALFRRLLHESPDLFLQRANWDGEGNYVLELGPDATPEDMESFAAANKGALTDNYFVDHGQAILKLRREKRLVIVDVGGMVQPEKQPILEACSHYLIISSDPQAIEPWHSYCRDRGNLHPLAVIHNSLEKVMVIHRREPYIEMSCGPFLRGQTPDIPDLILEKVRSLLKT
jgi:CRISPR-associated protein Csx3